MIDTSEADEAWWPPTLSPSRLADVVGVVDGPGHVDEHASKPVVGDRCQKVRRDAQLGATERRRHGIAAEGDSVVAGDGLLVPLRNLIRHKGDVDIGLSDEQRFQRECPSPKFVAPGITALACAPLLDETEYRALARG
jgi:hypothetical protein